jgi:putative ABC transport system ATP-binding protein
MSPQKVIRTEKLSKTFFLGSESVHALVDVDLSIDRGDYVALMGPSGSGKSTLMNILGCLDTPSSGRYILNGADVSQLFDDELA